MKAKRIKGIDIKLLSNKDVAEYIEKIFENPKMHELMQCCKSADDTKNKSNMLAEFLIQYALSTGDLNIKEIDEISNNFIERLDDYTKLLRTRCDMEMGKKAKQLLFEDVVMPKVVMHWIDKLNLTTPLSLKDFSRISSAIGLQTSNNVFRTHSFNSAILPDVERNGLDISKELFREELQEFGKLSHQPYMTGVLNTCELSGLTFGYASVVPERVNHTYSSVFVKRMDNETLNDYLNRCVDDRLSKADSMSDAEKEQLKKSSQKVIDFYYGHTKASIAVIRQDYKLEEEQENHDESILYALSQYTRMPMTRRKLNKLDRVYRDQIMKLAQDAHDPEGLEKLENILDEIRNQSPENEEVVKSVKAYICGQCFCAKSLKNFLHALGDGYIIEGGKIDRSKFAIATYEDPSKLFPREKQISETNESI